MRQALALSSRFVLASGFTCLAILKLMDRATLIETSHARALYALAGGVEALLAISLMRRRTARAGARIAALLFLGGAMATWFLLATTEERASCRCFGALGDVSIAWALLTQGAIVLLSSVYLLLGSGEAA